jgi:RNA polymerase sigma-70 factor (ECF subfamily)
LKQRFTIEDLVQGCKRGERQAQEGLYRQLVSTMMGICLRYAKDRDDAEDILQTGFIRVFQKISDFRMEGSFEGWVKRIMVNTALEHYRKNLRTLTSVSLDQVQEEVCFSDWNALEVEDLLNVIQSLPNGYRMVFNMYALEGYSHKEIAEELGITESGSKSQLSRARALLKEKIKQLEFDDHAKQIR